MALKPHHAVWDTHRLPPATLRRYRSIARDIIARWVTMMRNLPSRMLGAEVNSYVAVRPRTIETWLKAASINSSVMHDTCDANMIFDVALHQDRDTHVGDQADTDEWNDVTYNYGLLEAAAADALRRLNTARHHRHRQYGLLDRPGAHRVAPCTLHQDCIDNPTTVGATCVRVCGRKHR